MQIPFKHSIIQSEHLIRTFNPNIQFEHSIQTFNPNIQFEHSIQTLKHRSQGHPTNIQEHGNTEHQKILESKTPEHLPENQELTSEFVCKYMQNAQNTSTHRN